MQPRRSRPSLHPSPTRRSSDLTPGGLAGVEPDWSPDWAVTVVLASRGYPESSAKGDPIAGLDRSEEHTSELPSPCNLVCRLLLERENSSLDGCPFAPTHFAVSL